MPQSCTHLFGIPLKTPSLIYTLPFPCWRTLCQTPAEIFPALSLMLRKFAAYFCCLCALIVFGPAVLEAQETPTETNPAEPIPASGQVPLKFAFDRMPWRDVIEWLASSADLALHVRDLPTGSFTYTDPSTFTPQEAIDRVNLFLLSEGFTLIRTGRLLTVIDLNDPRSAQQLDAIAKLVPVEKLDELSEFDVVKCIFPLGRIDAAEAVEELAALKLMAQPGVFARTNRLLVIDTVGKLRAVKLVLESFDPEALENGTIAQNFALEHVTAEDILVVARPHLGLASGEMIGIDVSLSADLQGKNIFVTGVEDRVKLIADLVEALDKPANSGSVTKGAVLQSHVVEGGNVEIVYNVLLTLLADKSVRLSMDEKAGSVVALASPEIQLEIAETVQQLQATEADFEVIPLKNVDPYFAITLLEQMLDLPDPFLDPDDKEEFYADAPKIDADPDNMRLFVRGRKHQIEQIKKIVAGLDAGRGSAGNDSQLRVIPLRGKDAERILETAARFWRTNPVFLYPSTESSEQDPAERTVTGETKRPATFRLSSSETVSPASPNARLLTRDPYSQEPAIRCQFTPRGLLMQCEDAEALNRFEDHLTAIAGPLDSAPSPPTVFYLKYTKPFDALQMLAELLDGGEAAKDGESGSLVNGYVAGSDSYLGSLVSSRDGTMTMIAGSITIVADSRLNRLIAQGTETDIAVIEGYLKIIDKDKSITSIETYGTSHVIELIYSDATEVAESLRAAYAGRVAGGPGNSGQQRAGSVSGTSQQREDNNKKDSGEKSSGDKNDKKQPKNEGKGGELRDLEPKMTIAVHAESNSLIVTAPEQLFAEVEKLARIIDTRSQKAVRVIRVPDGVGKDTLREIFSGRSQSRPVATPQKPGR